MRRTIANAVSKMGSARIRMGMMVANSVVLFVGFAISVVYGLFGMVGIFLWGLTKTFLVLAGVSFLLAVGAVLWLIIGLDKRYERIVQR